MAMSMTTSFRARILIIDDEKKFALACRTVLEEDGHHVRTCMRGCEGLELLRREDFDVVLLDLRLGDMDGMRILEESKSINHKAYIIIMTAFSTVPNAVKAMKMGAFDYLTKPFTDDQLMLAVARAVEKKKLVEENARLREELVDRYGFSNIVGENPKMLEVFKQIERVAPTDSSVLIYGEHGTGKELVARAIHAHSRRALEKFVAIDGSALSPTLLESELFGHVKGAFTGATQDKAGIFQIASKGTLFLDDIANLNLEIQGKLLRVLESREYKPVGASEFKTTEARVISATNKDLRSLTTQGQFREDLYYRINVFPIFLPPLRERQDDIPRLAYHFLHYFCRKMSKRIEGFTEDALEALVKHPWPGNVRQLKNAVERLVIISDDKPSVDLETLLDALETRRLRTSDGVPSTWAEMKSFKKTVLREHYERVERLFLLRALQDHGGNITKAAQAVGMQRSNFSALMKRYRIPAGTPQHSTV
ncbi:sigma-54-dependent transcriptional regulator [Desulfosoma caldarium]|uniref:Two component Fis family sigma54 specific transcriptional regulator n=1 Tax=Desulfosoma caldarium TaxID=610254 RepID=A0A3N1UFV8_9BACT|nr:sigma-54 dependent transcriptional regulator [Desulfosoma caldarium]ROQ90212.1 two component Fis family sigma54 specific transcriptional regulator [Desulfosoma caldarium]